MLYQNNMEIKSYQELYFVLMPTYAIILAFIGIVPLVYLLGCLINWIVGLLFLITAMVFFLVYEWLHCIYHLPSNWKIKSNKIIQRLSLNHQKHHAPKGWRYNFNVTLPIFDYIMKTKI
jgi:sterol desaturase/sphingolipid hydroxylase (fatty acid hydroxylase superfamily)